MLNAEEMDNWDSTIGWRDVLFSVAEFHDTFETNISVELAEKLVTEEREEVAKELADLLYVMAGSCYARGENVPLYQKFFDLITELCDELGIDIDEAFRRVHRSNMSKVGDNGKPVRREDGKILKGPNYQPPSMEGLV